MMIQYLESIKQFQLNTQNTTYALAIADDAYLLHIYWGKKLPFTDLTYLLRLKENPFTPTQNERDRACFFDTVPFEYPCGGTGDYREPAFGIEDMGGFRACNLTYLSHRIYCGKPVLQGLPHTFSAINTPMETLEITMVDKPTGLTVLLSYTVFADSDAIIRSVKVRNDGTESCKLTRVLSCSVDIDNERLDMLTLYGSWARERQVSRVPIGHGKQRIDSLRGESSHQYSPFFALLSPQTTEQQGDAYGFTIIYSGNFFAQAELTQHGMTRAQIGINPDDFVWQLNPTEEFQAPEAVMVYSAEGLGGMSRCYHKLFYRHLIRSQWKDKNRPVLINNWEATYFDFNLEKLQHIAKEAAALGIELFVLDDGWFGHRDSDNCSLGDWKPDERKLPGGLKPLTDTVTELGMRFGLWFEPEMVSPDSDLYRAHPDWAIQIPNRPMTLCRAQYVLDMSREEVRDAIWAQMKQILDNHPISYIKWDMNRQLTELGSAVLPATRQKELWHRYVLGVYDLMERLVTEYPDLLLENCSGGGARFDPGMLYYSPQIWSSDDTDARERLRIQYGASLFMPPSAMGAHVSVCPNHATGRNTPFDTRANVAMNGTFGYELDVTKLSDEDKAAIPEQIHRYHRYSHLVRNGLQYRLGDPFGGSACAAQMHNDWDAWIYVAEDGSEALFTFVQITAEANLRSRKIALAGLQPDAQYQFEWNGQQQTMLGAVLNECGVLIPNLWGDMRSVQIYLQRVNE
ncbi:MAG: alpha-galactosidase [Oscillospiraceae bacterium]